MRALLLPAVLFGALVVGACSSTPPAAPPANSPAATSAGPGPSSAPATTPAKLVEITVKGRSVSPPPGRIDIVKGEKVKLVVHSDSPDEIHVHGYDLEAKVGPGQDAVIEFAGTRTGLFEVETHDSGLLLTQLAVR